MKERILWVLAGIAVAVLAGAALYALDTAGSGVDPELGPKTAASVIRPEADTTWCLNWERNAEVSSDDAESTDLRHAAEAMQAAEDGYQRGLFDVAEASVMYHEAVADIDRICEGILR